MMVELSSKILGTALALGVIREREAEVGSSWQRLAAMYEREVLDAVIEAARNAIAGQGGENGK